jgi:hypothetical protein
VQPPSPETIVLHALSWSAVFILLALWSLASWAFHSVATWTLANAGALAAGPAAIGAVAVPGWLAPWIPPEAALAWTAALSAVSPAIESALALVPALGGGLSVAVWVIWGLGAAALLILGLVSHWLITLLRNRAPAFAIPG